MGGVFEHAIDTHRASSVSPIKITVLKQTKQDFIGINGVGHLFVRKSHLVSRVLRAFKETARVIN
jgi:hypothetical protein